MRTTLYAAIGVLAAIYLVYAFATVDRRSDSARVAAVVSSAAAAAEDHSLNGVISHVSRNYKDDQGFNYDRLRLLAAQALREKDVEFRVLTKSGVPRFENDTAIAPVRLRVTKPGGEVVYDRELTVHFARERGRHMMLVPVGVWRVVKVDNLTAGIGY